MKDEAAMTRKKNLITISREFLPGIFILLPYIERGFIANILAVYFREGYIKAIVTIMLFLSVVLLLLTAARKKRSAMKYNLCRAEKILAFYLFVRIFFQWPFEAKYFSTMLWIVVPIIYSLILVNYFRVSGYQIEELLRSVFFWFSAYAVFVVFYNVIFLGLYRDSSVRMTASAGGPVIFGYTIAFMYSLLVANKRIFEKRSYLIYTGVLFLCAVSTGSRGALWPMLAIAAFDWLRAKVTIWKVFSVILIFAAVIIIDPIRRLEALFPHLFTTANTYRAFTLANSLLAFQEADWPTKIFGYGIGNVFPYQKWLLDVSENTVQNFENIVDILGRTMLVQPHNTYVYMILESGLCYVALLIYYAVVYFKGLWKKKNAFALALPCVVFLFINFFDSVICVAPGVAASLWTLLLLHHISAQRG